MGPLKWYLNCFFQLYTIHALHNSQVIPCVYALLPNKQQLTYTAFFQVLRDAHDNLNPETVLVDFELGAINALRATFPDTELQGCLYHLSQCVYRHVQDAGLQARYAADDALSLVTRMLVAIAFVPVNDIIDSFELLQEELPNELQPVTDYFEDTFIGRPGIRNHRRDPKFPHNLWNVFERVAAGLPRTNNNIEGWHRRMSASVGCHHLNIWLFLDVLKREQAMNRLLRHQIIAGEAPPLQRRQYRDLNQRLQMLVAQLS